MKKSVVILSCLISSINAKLNGPRRKVQEKMEVTRNINFIECEVSKVHGLAVPGSPEVAEQYACTTDEGGSLFFDSDASELLGAGFVSGDARLALAPQAISDSGSINIQRAMIPGLVAISAGSNDGVNRKSKVAAIGNKQLLVIRVVSNDYEPAQSEAQLYDDVFGDDNNLRVRYNDCSNGALIFDPATGGYANNGVLTVTTTENLNGMSWKACGNIGFRGSGGIARDYTMIVCPDEVDFGNAAAYAVSPGSMSWFKSQYASAPTVQMHELGHNLGHGHSGKNNSTYYDPTCNMGNRGSWTDEGSNFCFNAGKTWGTKWYSEYHVTVDPSQGYYDGTLVGINAVKDKTIAPAGQDVVLKISSSGEIDLYIMFNRKAGANNEVPENGDEVIITEQAAEMEAISSWTAGLSVGQTYTQDSWSGSGTLTVQVCSLETGSPGSARILVYATGRGTLSCDKNNNTPSPSAAPNSLPTGTTDDSLLCQDSEGKFAWKNGKRKPCKFLAIRNKNARCKFAAAAAYCPVTCEQNCKCHDTLGVIKLPNGKERTCDFAARNPAMLEKRCLNNTIRSNCPVTCKVC